MEHKNNIKNIFENLYTKFKRVRPYLIPLFALFLFVISPSDLSRNLGDLIQNVLNLLKTTLIGDKIIDFGIGMLINFLKGETVKKEDIEKITSEIINITYQLENLSKSNIEIHEAILKLNESFINSEEFQELSKDVKEIKDDIKSLREEIENELSEIKNEIEFIKKINIPKIEKYLKKDEVLEPKYFRTEGFLWVDFESGYVYKPPVVDEIIDRIEKENIIVIKEIPASGKSTILRYVGYLLKKDKNYDVYYIDLKSFPREKILEIYKIRHGVLIVEDAHLYVDLVEDLINNLNAKLIISSRDIDIERTQEFGPTRESRFSDYLKNAIVVKPEDEAEKIIRKFEEKEEKLPQEIKRKLARNNLWVLRWQLDTYKKDKRIDEEYVYKNIRNYLKTLPDVKNSDNIFLLLSIFYKYEIPVRKSYLIDFLEIDDSEIDNLEKLNEVIVFENKGKTYIGLHHSELAKLYFKTFIYFRDEALKVKGEVEKLINEYDIDVNQIKDEKLVFELVVFIDYLIKYPEEFSYIIKLHFYKSLFKYLLNNNQIKNNFEIFIKKLDEFSVNLYFVISNYQIIFYEFFKNLNSKVIEEKISEWENIDSIVWLIRSLKKVRYNWLDEINIEVFEEKIKSWNDTESIVRLIRILKEVGYKNLDEINVEVFEEKIRECHDIWDIGCLIESLKDVDYKALEELIERIGIEVFEEKIREWNEVEGIYSLIKSLKKVGYNWLDEINIEVFEEKIREWSGRNDISRDILRLIWNLNSVGYEKLDEIKVEVLEEIIKKLDFLSDISDLIRDLKEVGHRGLDEIKVEVFEEKIRGCNNLFDISDLIATLKWAEYKEFDELMDKIEVEVFEEKIRDCDYSREIVSLIWILRKVGYKKLDEIKVELFEEKIKRWKNVKGIVRLIRILRKVGYKKLDEINIEVFEEKIKRWNDARGISILIESLKEFGYNKLDEIKVEVFEEKIKRWNDSKDIFRLIKGLKKIEYRFLKELMEKLN